MGRLYARKVKADALHASFESTLALMNHTKRRQITATERKNVIESLSAFKRNPKVYDLGKQQLVILDALIKRAENAKSFNDLLNIHSNTCALGLKKN